MHYYYDLLVNLDTCFWEYYEWEKTDNLFSIKKIPLVKVADADLKKFLEYDISFDKDWIKPFLNKTLLKGKREKLSCILFSSGKNAVVFEIDDDGKVLSRSRLLVIDENECNEVAANYKVEGVEYQLLDKLLSFQEFRKARYEKHFIEIEMDTLKNQGNLSKISYLYYEWFGVLEHDLDKMIADCYLELQKPYTLKIHEIAELIEMSYKERL